MTLQRFVVPPGAFRLLLALVVVASHISDLDIGRLAVVLFFFLSGFWVSKIWAEKFAARALWRFYASRYLRIMPLYLLALLVVGIFFRVPLDAGNLLLLGVASRPSGTLDVAWSLDVELQFYLLLPLLVALAVRSPIAALVVSIVGAAAGWAFAGATHIVTALQYLPAFTLGALTWRLNWKPSERLAIGGAAVFALVTAAVAFTSFFYKTAPDPFDRDLLMMVWMLPLLPYVARSLMIHSSARDRALGDISYPLYLFHVPVISGVVDLVGSNAAPVRAAAALASVGVAWAVWLVLDRRIDAWRVRLTERPRAKALASA